MTDEKDKCIIKEKIREVYHTKKINKYVSSLSVLIVAQLSRQKSEFFIMN